MLFCKHCNHEKLYKKGQRENQDGSVSYYYTCPKCNKNNTFRKEAEEIIEDIPLEEYLTEYSFDTEYKTVRRYVITSCQSNAQTNIEFLDSLVNYCDYQNAQLFIIPVKYRSGNQSEVDPNKDMFEFDPILEDYFLTENVKLHKHLNVLGKLKITPTSVNPLSGLDAICKGNSVIIGHSQLQLKTLAVAKEDFPVILTTTGTVSYPEYSESKAGYKAEFNHQYSAILVEIDENDLFHIRQLEFDGNGFYDLDRYYDQYGENNYVGSIDALITGDEHAIFADPNVTNATYGETNSITSVMRPRYIVRHDLVDSYSISHHHKTNVFTQYAKYKSGVSILKNELDYTIDYVVCTTRKGSTNVIVSSNHNDHITKWLNETDPKQEPWNALLYHELMYKMLSKTEMLANGASYPNPFELYSKDEFVSRGVDVKFLNRDQSFKLHDIELAFHGDKGNNGSRGSRLQFSKLPYRSVIGHSHSPGIEKGCYQVGTSSYLNMEYNAGPSSWMNTHCIVYLNGKRTLINVVKGKWRA